MDRRELFPDAHAIGVEERVAKFWELGWPLPVPKWQPSCAGCTGLMVLKDWKFHNRARTGSTAPWRCDARLKCIECSVVTTHGVLVPKAMTPIREGEWITWREGRDILARARFFEGEPNA